MNFAIRVGLFSSFEPCCVICPHPSDISIPDPQATANGGSSLSVIEVVWLRVTEREEERDCRGGAMEQ